MPELWTMPAWMEKYRGLIWTPSLPEPRTVEDAMNAGTSGILAAPEVREKERWIHQVRTQVTLLTSLYENGHLK